MIRQLESRANGLDTLRAKTIAERASTQSETERARSAIGVPFKHAAALAEASEKLDAVNAELAAKALAQERPADLDGEDEPSPEAVAAPVGACASDDIPSEGSRSPLARGGGATGVRVVCFHVLTSRVSRLHSSPNAASHRGGTNPLRGAGRRRDAQPTKEVVLCL